jgi:LysR family transcriptional activator of glutamate synthase operon
LHLSIRAAHIGAVDLSELRWFVCLAETGHVTEAAARLHVTQPTLSRGLARLEREIGLPLFDRRRRRLRLNPYGQILLEHARRSLAELVRAEERIHALADPDHGVVRLAFLHSLGPWLVPELLRRYRDRVPGVRFALREDRSRELARALLHGDVDLAVTGPRPTDAGLDWHVILRERLCVAVPPHHRLRGRRRISLREVADEPFVAIHPELDFRHLTDQLCRQAAVRPTIAFESADLATVAGMVAAGFGVAILPAPRRNPQGHGPVFLPLSEPEAYREIGLAWAGAPSLPPVVERFRAFVVAAAEAGL